MLVVEDDQQVATVLGALLESEGHQMAVAVAALGMPMDELERRGALRVACRHPEATSPEDLLIDLRVGLDEFNSP